MVQHAMSYKTEKVHTQLLGHQKVHFVTFVPEHCYFIKITPQNPLSKYVVVHLSNIVTYFVLLEWVEDSILVLVGLLQSKV